MISFLIGELLFLANSYPPVLHKREFYEMKDRLLKQFSRQDGYDLQHIQKMCYQCNGTGKVYATISNFGEESQVLKGSCYSCNGTGIYREFWTVLNRHWVGRRMFHSPQGRLYESPDVSVETGAHLLFTDYLKHRIPRLRLYAEAQLWLALLFDWPLFMHLFDHCGYPGWKVTPLAIWSDLAFDLSSSIRRAQNWVRWQPIRWTAWKQEQCQHQFPDTERPGRYDICQKCGIERRLTEDDIPF